MTIQVRLFCLVIGLFLALGTDALAASKRKHRGGKRRPAATKPVSKQVDENVAPPRGNGHGTERNVEAARTETRADTPAPAPARAEALKQESRIEFDERMLKGQSASGVIYLFQRTPSDWKSIVEVPESFRPRTVEILEGETK